MTANEAREITSTSNPDYFKKELERACLQICRAAEQGNFSTTVIELSGVNKLELEKKGFKVIMLHDGMATITWLP